MRNYINKTIIVVFLMAGYLLLPDQSSAQDSSRHAVTGSAGVGINNGLIERGQGVLLSLGFRKSYWDSHRLRIHPHLMTGEFFNVFAFHGSDMYYSNTSLNIDVQVDALKYRSVSLVLELGVFGAYSRGMWMEGSARNGNQEADYFIDLYWGGSVAAGLRYDPPESRMAYQLNPFNLHIGSPASFTSYINFGLEYDLIQN